MSFALTKDQFRNRTKTVTRRNGWIHAKEGDHIRGVEKGMGLRKGEKIKPLGVIEVVSTRRERIDAIDQADVVAEGFPNWTPKEFVEFYCKANRKEPSDLCTRIEFKYL